MRLQNHTKRIYRAVVLAVGYMLVGITAVSNQNNGSAFAQSVLTGITWVEPKLNLDASPGESLTREIIFTSDSKLKNVTVEASPELIPFMSIQPASMNKVKPNKRTSIQLSLSISPNTPPGVYAGTLTVKSRDQLVLERLAININIWQQYTDAIFGFKISAPFGSGVSRSQDSVDLQVLGLISPNQPRSDYGGQISVFRWFNPRLQAIDDFFDGNQGTNFMKETTAKEAMTIDGRPAVLFKEVAGASTENILVVRVDPYFLVFQMSDDPATFSRILQSIKILN